jgi:hypothetical protein
MKIVEPELSAHGAAGRNALNVQDQQSRGLGSGELGMDGFPEIGAVEWIAGVNRLSGIEITQHDLRAAGAFEF